MKTGSRQVPEDVDLVQEVERLEPSLQGFPVAPLVHLYVSAEPSARGNAYRLLDRCIDTWLESLEGALETDVWHSSEAATRIQDTQRGTRDALAQLKKRLSRMEVVRPAGGQAC